MLHQHVPVIHISKENFSSTISSVSCIHFNILIYLMVVSRVKSWQGKQTISARSACLLNIAPNIIWDTNLPYYYYY